jgi:nucleoside-diphosphate-sugar epimerase
MKVLLLGATGLLGHNVLRRLLAEGHRVVALVRKGRSLLLQDVDCELKECDAVDNYDVLLEAARGCEAVVNCAGVTDMSLLCVEDYLDINVLLLEKVVDVMEDLKIKRLVHVSTVDTIGYGTAEHPADESEPMRYPFDASNYAISKDLCEGVLADRREEYPELEYVVVNPGFMLGPYDAKPSSGRMLLAAYRKPVMFAPKGGKAFVHVDDVAGVVVAALTKGVPGQRYIAVNSHACLSIKELYRMQARVCGYRQWVLTAPSWLLLAAGYVGDLLRKMGVRTQVCTMNIRQLLVREYYDNSLARKDLGMKETPIEDAIREFHEWRKNRQ